MNTILFDLDGTLLPLDMEKFTKEYFKLLAEKLSNYIDPTVLPKIVWQSTEYMISTEDSTKTNMDCFFEDFKTRVDHDLKILHPIFDEFYINDFQNLKDITNPSPLSRLIIKELREKGYDVVVATNPLFPREAIHHRIKWAGLDKEDFKLITTYEVMHFCKPSLEYYKEILSKIGKKPSEVMMVGNDVQEDIVSGEIGIRTYLIEDCIIDREKPKYSPDYRGSLNDLYEFVKNLEPLG